MKLSIFGTGYVGLVSGAMGSKVIVDGRNLYQPHKLQAEGWAYLSSVGRAQHQVRLCTALRDWLRCARKAGASSTTQHSMKHAVQLDVLVRQHWRWLPASVVRAHRG